jgi:predicted permease
LGRGFLPEEFEPGRDQVTVLTDALWQRRFGGDPGVLGDILRINGRDHVINGVLPPESQLAMWRVQLLTPANLEAWTTVPTAVKVFGRLRPDFDIEVAREEIDAIIRRSEESNATPVKGWATNLAPVREEVVGEVELALLLLLVAVALVLVIAVADVSNLFLARAFLRRQEVAIRAAVGAAPSRILRQLITEAVGFSLLGGAFGILLAFGSANILKAIIPPEIPRVDNVALDMRALLGALVLTVLTGVLAGVSPALTAVQSDFASYFLGQGGTGAKFSARGRKVQSVLATGAVAMTVTLLVMAGLMLRSFLNVVSVDPGFETKHILTMELSLPDYRYPALAQRAVIIRETLDRLGALPHLQSVAASTWTPLTRPYGRAQLSFQDRLGLGREWDQSVLILGVTPNYFRTMGIRLMDGRTFDESKAPGKFDEVIVSQSLTRRAWPNQNPIGKRLKLGAPESDYPWLTVIGVVRDSRLIALTDTMTETVFMPFFNSGQIPGLVQLAIRTSADPLAAVASIREAVWQIDAELPVDRVATMEQLVRSTMARQRFQVLLLGVFAVVALAIALLGVYNLVSQMVAQRRREICVRVALGAKRLDVLKLVVSHAMCRVLIGVALGVVVSVGVTQLLTSLLFHVDSIDARTIAWTVLVLGATGFLASVVPARKATRLDPMAVLRVE